MKLKSQLYIINIILFFLSFSVVARKIKFSGVLIKNEKHNPGLYVLLLRNGNIVLNEHFVPTKIFSEEQNENMFNVESNDISITFNQHRFYIRYKGINSPYSEWIDSFNLCTSSDIQCSDFIGSIKVQF
ncbi:hypothetical protein BB559_006338 [Furculomyces boomerangus]|uniref:Uncharacterized protein n=2 Tax=Harpellales TaxID=61421 RepID=A0A2T9Y3J9_9FUNG|nr:hypothetical protein BB559_006338 [Furculomyces boomerangus]PVZ96465.1 hypothetical protein BB558_007647 [Smittium angustum]PWA03327.1 hypothetical protein BB558_000508 [Smittium angustum]